MKINRTNQDLIVTAFGIVASMVTAVILYLVEQHLSFAFYSLTLWFVIPVGAILSGFVAGVGYYLGSILFGHRPTHLLLLNMVLVSIGTFFMIYWISYISLEIDGKSVSNYISFSKYLDMVLQHQTIEFGIKGSRSGTTGELGSWGYVTAILQIIGFALGGFVLFLYLVMLPYCEICHKYLKAKSKQVRYTRNLKAFTAMAQNLLYHFANNQFQEALDIHGKFGESKQSDIRYLSSIIEIKQCPICNVNWLKFSAKQLVENDWKDIDGIHFAGYHDGELQP